MLRRTKIVATLGPASERPKTLRKMIHSGLDVARLNFSHGSADEHRQRARRLRKAAEECGRDIGLLGDLQGPKIRVMRFKRGSVHLRSGDAFFLDSTLGLNDGTKKGVGVALETLHEDVKPGDTLLLNDGLISLQVDSVEGTRIHTTVVDGGILSDHKGINLKGGGGFRSNVGFVSLGGGESTVALVLHDAAGAAVGDPLEVSVPPGQWTQYNDVFAAVGAPPQALAWAEVSVLAGSGSVWAYASVVDNASNDPTTIPVQRH